MKRYDQIVQIIESGDYTDKDVQRLLVEAERYRRIDKALLRIIEERNTRIHELERRVRMYEVVKS